MFKNDYQGGPAFEIFSSQGSSPLVNWKTGTAKKCVQKQYDSSVKGYVFACDKAGKLICPKDDKMGGGLLILSFSFRFLMVAEVKSRPFFCFYVF